jgi:hypothetical protein
MSDDDDDDDAKDNELVQIEPPGLPTASHAIIRQRDMSVLTTSKKIIG